MGSFWLLREVSSRALLICLYVICIAILPVGREFFEGLPYNISWASQFGDLFLVGVIIIGGEILKNTELNARLPANTVRSQWIWFFICLTFGAMMQLVLVNTRPRAMVIDTYHNVVVISLLFNLLIAAGVVIYKYGNFNQKRQAIFFLAIWLVLLVLDAINGRLDQQLWLKQHGINLLKL